MALPTYFELIPAFQQFIDGNGNPLNAGTIETYTAGTSTPKATYRESDGAVSNGTTITLDSSGYTPYGVWGTTGAYKVILKNSGGATLRTRDNVTSINDITRTGLILESSQVISNASSANITLSTSYQVHHVEIINLVPATDNVELWLRTSSDGVNYDTGASDYRHARVAATDAGTSAAAGSTGDTKIVVSAALGNSTGEAINGSIKIYDRAGALYKPLQFDSSLVSSAPQLIRNAGSGVRVSTGAIVSVRILCSSGNISSATIKYFGIAE